MDRNLGIWEMGGDAEEIRSIDMAPGLGGHVYAMDLCRSNPRVVALGVGDETIRLWDLESGGEDGGVGEKEPVRMSVPAVSSIWRPIQAKVTSLAWHPTDG